VVDKFVEFYGDGLDHLAVNRPGDESPICRRPENGRTVTVFPAGCGTTPSVPQH